MSIFFRKDNNIGYIEFDNPDAKVNILTGEVLKRLDAILDEVRERTDLKAVVILSKKKDVFIAGADIKEIEGITEPADAVAKSKFGQDIFNKLEDLSMPTIAVIDGVALGGGCELVLACRWRLATFNEKVRIGLPEVNLGILPGFGGTYRMPRVVGLERAVRLITTCKILSSSEALKFGLVDRLLPQAGLGDSLQRFIEEIPSQRRPALKKKTLQQRFLEDTFLGRYIFFWEARRATRAVAKGFYPAPMKVLDVLEATYGQPREQVLALERKGFSELVLTDVCKNLIKVFYLSEKYKKLSGPDAENVVARNVEKAAVLGAGVMGGGIAQLLSAQGMSVRLKDVNFDAIGKGLKAARKVFDQAVAKKKMNAAEARLRMAQITGTLDYSGFNKVDLVIEAVVENIEIKKKVFLELSRVASPQAILATNTSALSVTEMAQAAREPSRVVGLHFFNPVHRMPLVEIVKTPFTSKETLVTALALVKRLGKTPVIVKDVCGFLVNRVLLGYLNEAGRMLEEGASVTQIDNTITAFGLPMGPFALTDEVGTDVGIKVLHVLHSGLGERFKPVEIFEKVHQAGFLGKKSGKGFYLHGRSRSPNPQVASMIVVKKRRPFSAPEALERMMLLMVNEAARCLEEKVVDEAAAVDVGMIMGTGFPPFRGGLLRYADHLGIDKVVERLSHFEETLSGERFRPCGLLLDLKNKGTNFYAA